MARTYLDQALLRDDRTERSEQAPLLTTAHESTLNMDEEDYLPRLRRFLRWFLSSKYGHYFVIILVSLDIACIFADFLVSLHVCEHSGDEDFNEKSWLIAEETLRAFSLAFSCLFMLELLASIFSFGFRYGPCLAGGQC